jgi:plasmid stability protein
MNITHLPANLSRTLSDRAQREHRSVEQIAIEALERGLSAGEALSDEDALWSENPQFDEAIQAFAAMEGE